MRNTRRKTWLTGGAVALLLALAVMSGTAPAQEALTDARIQVRPIQFAHLVAVPEKRQNQIQDPRAAAFAKSFTSRVKTLRARAQARLTARQGAARRALESRAGSRVAVRSRPRVGTPRQIRGKHLRRGGSLLASGADADVAVAREFLRANRELMRIENPDEEFVFDRKETDDLGRRQVRFVQHYKGLPLLRSEIIVHVDAGGDVDLAGGSYVPTPTNAVVVPRLTGPQAIAQALAEVAPGGIRQGPDLVLYVAEGSFVPRLAWRLQIDERLDSQWGVLVDALEGGILAQMQLVKAGSASGSGVDLFGNTQSLSVWQEGTTYYMVNAELPMYDPTGPSPPSVDARGAVFVADFRNQPEDCETCNLHYATSPSANSGWLPDAVSAAVTVSTTYDYLLDRHNRESIDGNGGSLYAVVRMGDNYLNAFYYRGWVHFGDAEPLAGALDVVAHELGHGVVEYTANLEYQGQSGALNESFADIFGEGAEAYSRGSNDWLLGTDTNLIFRSMKRPEDYGQPSKMSEYVTTSQDHGGVHTNSGIPNHAFYLLAEGMPNAIGMQAAERIFYRALKSHLTRSSQFIDARLACVSAAEELYGVASTEALQTSEAFALVEIGEAPGTDESPEYPEVQSDDATVFLFEFSETIYVGRREDALGDDPDIGIWLIDEPPAVHGRISVEGSGQIGIYVSDAEDAVIFLTDQSDVDPDEAVSPVELPDIGVYVWSVAMAPDGEHFAFVVRDGPGGGPTNEIWVLDIGTETSKILQLTAPVSDDGSLDAIVHADVMDFSSDNRFLVYDALNEVTEAGGSSYEVWSIYAVDLLTDATFTIVPPTPGFNVGNPSLSQTSDSFLTFEVFDQGTGQSTIYTADLSTGDTAALGTVTGTLAYPVYTGDDAAVVYSKEDAAAATGTSLVLQPVANRLGKVGGTQDWVADAALGTIYRRGTYTTPNAQPEGQINTPVSDVRIEEGETVNFAGTGSDPNGHYPLSFRWNFSGAAPASTREDPGPIVFSRPGNYVVSLTVTDSEGLADSTPHTRTVSVYAAPPPEPEPEPEPEPQTLPLNGGGGGFCTYNPNAGFDPTMLLVLLGLGGVRLLRRRRTA